jgi:hypothetical protein
MGSKPSLTLQLSIAAFESVKHLLPADDAEQIRGWIYDHKEWGLGMEVLVDAFLELGIVVTAEQKERIVLAMKEMKLDRDQEKLPTE